jgi:hypothetical protein
MAHGYAVDVLSLVNHKIRLNQDLKAMAVKYKAAQPFAHLVIDSMFDDLLLDRLVGEMPSLSAGNFLYLNDRHLTQYGLRSAVELGETGLQFVAFLHSAAFLYFLSDITGIPELLPDPYLQGGGYHVMPRGGKFDVHADRNVAYETGLTRRISLSHNVSKQVLEARIRRTAGTVEP